MPFHRIWNYTDESKADVKVKDIAKNDATAALRSNIRRRASIHGRRRNNANTRADSTLSALSRADGSNSTLSSTDIDRLRPARNLMSDDASARSQLLPPVPEPMLSLRQSMRDSPLTSNREGPQYLPRDYHHSQAPYHAEPASRTRLQVHQPSDSGPARRPTIHPTRPSAATARRAARRREPSNPPIYPRPIERERERPQSRDSAVPRTNLPTPPLDNDLSSILPSPAQILERNNYVASPNPYSVAEPHVSPDDGLGDRTRSVSPGIDVWQVMRNTITPDETLPSTSSSFTSAAAADASMGPLSPIRLPEEPDLSFEDTMLEMGINMSSTSPTSSVDSSSEPEQENDSDTSHDGTEQSSDEESEIDVVQRRRDMERMQIAMRLYDLAMRSSQGRNQIESQRRRIRDPNTSAPNHELSSNLPPHPEPYQFSAEVHSRAFDAAARIHAYLDPSPRPGGQDEAAQVEIGRMPRMRLGLNEQNSRASVAVPRVMDQTRGADRETIDRIMSSNEMRDEIRAMTERHLPPGEMREAMREMAARAVLSATANQTRDSPQSHDSNRNHTHVSQGSEHGLVGHLPADGRT